MTESSVCLQPAFILQQRKFRETSLILETLTRDYGKLSIVAKGVRTEKSKTAGLLRPFIPLLISYFGKTELKTLNHVEMNPPAVELQGSALCSGFYVNELLGYFLHNDDPHPELFRHYTDCIVSLNDASRIEAALRNFELNLLKESGYGLEFSHDAVNNRPVAADKRYHFDLQRGPVETADGLFSGIVLRAINRREFSDPQVRLEAKRLMRSVIDGFLQGKQLKSRTLITQMVKQLKHA